MSLVETETEESELKFKNDIFHLAASLKRLVVLPSLENGIFCRNCFHDVSQSDFDYDDEDKMQVHNVDSFINHNLHDRKTVSLPYYEILLTTMQVPNIIVRKKNIEYISKPEHVITRMVFNREEDMILHARFLDNYFRYRFEIKYYDVDGTTHQIVNEYAVKTGADLYARKQNNDSDISIVNAHMASCLEIIECTYINQ